MGCLFFRDGAHAAHPNALEKVEKYNKGHPGFEPETCRSAVDRSTTELMTHAAFAFSTLIVS